MPSLCQTESGVMIALAALSPTEPSDFTANCFTLHNTHFDQSLHSNKHVTVIRMSRVTALHEDIVTS